MEFLNELEAPDLNLSVYEIDRSHDELVRLVAEHYAASGLDPKTAKHFDVTALVPRAPIQTPAAGGLDFAKKAHREVRFLTAAELLHFAKQVYQSPTLLQVEKAEIKAHFFKSIESRDPGWMRLLQEDSPRGRKVKNVYETEVRRRAEEERKSAAQRKRREPTT